MARESIPKKLKDTLLDEYDHRCAVCGGDRPHIHHIDEDASHNELHNLLPLCPNCHLRDQHNPTRKIDISKLQLFRKYKDPAILKPQFHPIYLRQCFLSTVVPGEDPTADLESQATELIEFIQALAMGDFYGKRLTELVGPSAGRSSCRSGPGTTHITSGNFALRIMIIARSSLPTEILRRHCWLSCFATKTGLMPNNSFKPSPLRGAA